MFRSDQPVNYEEVYHSLIDKLARADYRNAMLHLGAREAGDYVAIDVLSRRCLVGPEGVKAADGRPLDFTVRIVLAYYVLHGGSGALAGQWVAYRDFKDGAFFYEAFKRIVEYKIAQDFSGRMDDLKRTAASLGAEHIETELGGDLGLRFPVLPNVPLLLIFYDADEDFPSSARVLFDASGPAFLDMECLAVLGLILADQLAAADH